jgi:hypothetical protein
MQFIATLDPAQLVSRLIGGCPGEAAELSNKVIAFRDHPARTPSTASQGAIVTLRGAVSPVAGSSRSRETIIP